MTASECIGYIDGIEPNAYNTAQKLGWLSECEGKVYSQLFLVQPYEFTPITEADSRILALPAPYDRIYPRYLQAMIHYANGEYDRYANSMAVFNEALGEANRWFGGDYDVTDRLRNRRFEAVVDPEAGDQTIMEIPRGCAIAAGRILVEQAFTATHPTYHVPEDLPGGTYCIKDGGDAHVTLPDIAAGTKLWIDSSMYILAPGSSIPSVVAFVSGKDGTELDFTPAAQIWQGDPENIVGTALLDKKGAAALPMLTGDRVGITFGPGYWDTPGTIQLTGHLLIPDQEWSYDSAYARRRDARWQS